MNRTRKNILASGAKFRIVFWDDLHIREKKLDSYLNTRTNTIYIDSDLSGAERRQHLNLHYLSIESDYALKKAMRSVKRR